MNVIPLSTGYADEDSCTCGRSLLSRAGDLTDTCGECRLKPKYCECTPLQDTAEDDPDRFERFDLAALAKAGVPPPVLFCNDLLYAGGLHSLAGPPDCGKSTLGYVWALQLIRAGEHVVIFDEESGAEQVVEKMTALGAEPGELENIHYYQFPGRSWTNADIKALADVLMVQPRPALVMWDSSAAFLARAGLDENAAADVTKFWSRVLTPCARRAGIAVLIIDHDVKNGEPSRYARGSGAKLAATDVAYKLEALKPFTRSQDGILKLSVTKDRRGWLHRYHRIRVEHGAMLTFHISEAEEDDPDATVTDLPPAQVKLLEAADSTPASVAELVDRIVKQHGHGLKRETVSRALNELLKAGLVDRLDQGPGHAALWARNG